MISLKKFLHSDKEESQSALLRVILLLLDASGEQAAELDPEECAFHRSSLRKVREEFEQLSDVEDAAVLGGGAAKSIESYNRLIEKEHRARGTELQGIISVMGDALLQLSSGSELASNELRSVQKRLEKASKTDDLLVLKGRLTESLDAICKEAARQEKVAADIRSELARLLNRDPQLARGPAAVSPASVTNAPALREAEEAISSAAMAGNRYVLVVVLERLELINARFGYEVGDQVLEIFRRHLTEALPATDQVFRWRGPCFVAILERPAGAEAVRAEARKLAAVRLEHSVETGGRSVLLTISRAFTIMALDHAAEGSAIANRIDAFAAEQSKGLSAQKPATPSLN